MPLALRSLLGCLLCALAGLALMAAVASAAGLGRAAAAAPPEAIHAAAEPACAASGELETDPPATDDPSSPDALPARAPLAGPASACPRARTGDDRLAASIAGHLDRPPRPLRTQEGSGERPDA